MIFPNGIPVIVINLREDKNKLSAIMKQGAIYDFVDFFRLEGVYGSTIPDQVCLALTNDPYAKVSKGAIGCFLSHVRAWEHIYNSELPWAIVIEDDAIFKDWSCLNRIELPQNFDLIFANNRTELENQNTTPEKPGLFEIKHSLVDIERRNHAVGTDCYIISRSGTRKLLDATEIDLYFSHIDLRMLAYSISIEDLKTRLPESAQLRKSLTRILEHCKRPNLLRTYSMSPSIVNHLAIKDTTRTKEDRQGSIKFDALRVSLDKQRND